jgi:hypothetical protein
MRDPTRNDLLVWFQEFIDCVDDDDMNRLYVAVDMHHADMVGSIMLSAWHRVKAREAHHD